MAGGLDRALTVGNSPVFKESAMTPLRSRMIDAMVQRGFALRTQESYIDAIVRMSGFTVATRPLSLSPRFKRICCI